MYKRILVPVDQSELAEQVLPYASAIAAGLSAEVVLLHAIEPLSLFRARSDYGSFLEEMMTKAHLQAREYLQKALESLKRQGLKASVVIHEGKPASVILDEAEREPATLIALSTHGRSGVQRWALGSVADRVLQATNVPLLLVRSHADSAMGPDHKFSAIVVPLDGSPLAEQVLPHVVALAKALGSGVSLLRVTPSVADYSPSAERPVAIPERAIKEADEAALAYLRQVSQGLRQQGVSKVEEHLLHGRPAQAINDFARQVPDNLVAMTTHGRSGVGQWVLGSVAERVVRHSEDPVLIVRAAGQSD